MDTYYQNQSCDPFTSTSRPCELGNLAVYSINVTGANDVIAGMQFAQQKNVRLSIHNTGHEYAPFHSAEPLRSQLTQIPTVTTANLVGWGRSHCGRTISRQRNSFPNMKVRTILDRPPNSEREWDWGIPCCLSASMDTSL